MQWVGWVEPLLAVADPFPDMAFPPNTHLGVVEKKRVGLLERKIGTCWMFSTLLCPIVKISKYTHWSEKKNLPNLALCEAIGGGGKGGKERCYRCYLEEFWSPVEASGAKR